MEIGYDRNNSSKVMEIGYERNNSSKTVVRSEVKKIKNKCWGCEVTIAKVHKCTKCCFAQYCSIKCKSKYAESHLRNECSRYKVINPLLRALSKAISQVSFTMEQLKDETDIRIVTLSLLNMLQNLCEKTESIKTSPIPGNAYIIELTLGNRFYCSLPDKSQEAIAEWKEVLVLIEKELKTGRIHFETAKKQIFETTELLLAPFRNYCRDMSRQMNNDDPKRVKELDQTESNRKRELDLGNYHVSMAVNALSLEEQGMLLDRIGATFN